MKNTNDDDAIAKALQERYSRILGSGEFKAPTEVSKVSPLRWTVGFFIIVISAAALGSWYFFRPSAVRTIDVATIPPKTAPQQPPLRSGGTELYLQTETGQPEPLLSEEPVSSANTGESTSPAEDIDLASLYKQQISEVRPSSNGEMKPKPVAPGALLVVLLSTTSKEEAIERAKELINSGNPSEVILSASGYYGVVLRHDTYEQAQTAIKALVASGVAKTAPYIMSADRVKAQIYPEIR
ncbi:hypothetical protein [Methylomicrobium lacus]|uniref:hypothetical protein n=1 Tax=Methylomicrobium lacus TaxID=136992 RepID=UPI0035A8BFBB